MSKETKLNSIMENQENAEVVKTGDWMLTYLISAIPVVGIVMLFVWAFGSGTNINKANWAKASLLWGLIILSIYLVVLITFGVAFLSAFHSN